MTRRRGNLCLIKSWLLRDVARINKFPANLQEKREKEESSAARRGGSPQHCQKAEQDKKTTMMRRETFEESHTL
jgi:hypothetical protein